MLFHMFKHAVIVLEESYMTEHIKLIIADDFVVIFSRRTLRLFSDAAIAATPAPGKVIFDVEQKRIGRSSLPVFCIHP